MDYSYDKTQQPQRGVADNQTSQLLLNYPVAPPVYYTLGSTAVTSECPRVEKRSGRLVIRFVHALLLAVLICILVPVGFKNAHKVGSAVCFLCTTSAGDVALMLS